MKNILEIPATFPARLRFYRQAQGLSLIALSRATKISPGELRHMESGRYAKGPRLTNLLALADALGVTTAHLSGEVPLLEEFPHERTI